MKYQRHRAVWPLLFALFFGSAHAVQEPAPGKADNRIREVRYDANNVVRIVGYLGFNTQVFLGRDEKILRISLGNTKAWRAEPLAGEGASFLISPISELDTAASSNLIVQTDLRLYTFELSLGANQGRVESPNAAGMMFQVRFCYDDCQQRPVRAALVESTAPVPAPAPVRELSWRYNGQGDIALRDHIRVWDDGVFTYMQFSAQLGPPAVYFIDQNDEETVPGRHVLADRTVVYHGVYKQWRLRYDEKRVLCVFKVDPIKPVTPQQTGILPGAKERRSP